MSNDDDELWDVFTQDIAPIKREKPREARAKKSPRSPKKPVPESITIPLKKPEKKQAAGAGLDRRTAEKLRKGQLRPEARIDLHGMRQDEAHRALHDFIRRAHSSGKRCVLVITGKGRGGTKAEEIWDHTPGVLKQNVPHWLAAADLAPLILKTHMARPEDGGEGALYVLLRRSR